MAKKKKNIINQKEHRYGLFVNDKSNYLDVSYGRQFIEKDNVHEVYLYKVKIIESKSHSLYGQAKSEDKVFSKPIRLNVMPSMDENEQEQYGGSGLVREDTGKLTCGIYMKELQEKGVDIDRGDIIRYNMSGEKNRYYEVESANNVNDTPEYSFGGFYIYWKKIVATPVKDDTIPIDQDDYDFERYGLMSGIQKFDQSGVEWENPVSRISDAPIDGETYVRKDGEWIRLVLENNFRFNINPSEQEKFIIDNYVTNSKSITKITLESDGIIYSVSLLINNNLVTNVSNLEVTDTITIIDFQEPVSLNVGDKIELNTVGSYDVSTNPTVIFGKLIY
ncbi:MAG: hypothetical protein ACOCVF_00675 [bacterium]